MGNDGGTPQRYELPMRLGRYTLTELLAVGGMAEVFLAQQHGPAGFQKTVVVKRIHPYLARDQNFVRMFMREARVAAQLAHPNLMQIFELCEVDGHHFIVMEHIAGLTVQRLAQRAWAVKRSIPLEVVAAILADAALVLQHAHSSNVIHRDVSPENLIVTTEGVTKVLDFGLAKPQRGATLTGVDEIRGKLPFMAPEQVRGDTLDGRADVYALGATAYWLVTGRRPIDPDNELALLTLIMTEQPAPPSKLNRAIPAAFDELVMAMLEKDRAHRPYAAEVHDALCEYAAPRASVAAPFVAEMMSVSGVQLLAAGRNPPVEFPPSSPQTTRTLGRKKRSPRVAWLAASAAIVLIVAALTFVVAR